MAKYTEKEINELQSKINAAFRNGKMTNYHFLTKKMESLKQSQDPPKTN